MPVELRKRPAPKEPATAPPPTKRGSGAGNTAKKLAEKAKAAVTSKATKDDSVQTAAEAPTTTAAEPKTNGTVGTGGKIGVGEKITLDGFGGTLQTNDGQDVTLKELLDKSLAGVVIFTYPRASTPGCKSTLFCAYVWYHSFRQCLLCPILPGRPTTSTSSRWTGLRPVSYILWNLDGREASCRISSCYLTP